MEKNKKKKLIKRISPMVVLILLAMVLVVVAGYLAGSYFLAHGGKMTGAKYSKVLLIGIDGMDPDVIAQLMSEGKLPNFQKLGASGTFIRLNTSYPPASPVAWTSIATGSNPGKHNMFDFIIRDPKTYLPKLSISETKYGIGGTEYISNVKAPAFWRITSDKKIPTSIINWPAGFPPEKVTGRFLSGLGVPSIKGFQSGHSIYTTEQGTEEETASKKVITVKIEGDAENKDKKINTLLFGPKVRKGSDIVDMTAPMQIVIKNDESAEIIVDSQAYPIKLKNWSSWIRIRFSSGTGKDVYGTFKANLISIIPFKMFITTIQIDPENPVTPITYPASYSKDLAKEIGLYYTLGMAEESDPFLEGKISEEMFLEQTADIDSQRTRMFMTEFENFKNQSSGVFAFVFVTSDHIQHVFWEQNEIGNENGNLIKLNKAVEDYWIAKDKFIGEVLQGLDNQTLLLIVSDHGFSSFERAVSLNNWLVENGFMSLKSSSGAGDSGAGVRSPLFKDVDWSKTKAYALGFNSIYINLKGREANGIVDQKDQKAIIQDIATKLEQLKDDKTGGLVVNKAYKSNEIYTGDYVSNAPDIIVGYMPGYRASWETAVGGLAQKMIADNEKKWSGDHLIDPIFVQGTLLSNAVLEVDEVGEKGEGYDYGSASQMDVAPTILDALGIKIPKEMDGKSLLK